MSEAWLVRLGGLGDLLVALPAIRLVRETLPGVSLLFVGRKEVGRLLADAGIVEEVASADERRWLSLFDGEARDSDGPEPDFVFSWFHSRAAPSLGENLRRLFPRVLAVEIRADPSAGGSLTESFFDRTSIRLAELGFRLPALRECAGLPVSSEAKESARALLGRPKDAARFAVIHPGSGGLRKCWPLPRFLEVAAFLASRGWPGVVVTGEAEERLEDVLRRAVLPPGWIWRPRPRLSDLAGLLALAGLYVGNDSGVTHLAAACGARVAAVFREEHVPAWRPLGAAAVLSAPEVSDVPSEAVIEALAGLLC